MGLHANSEVGSEDARQECVETSENLFTWALYRNSTDNSQLQQNVSMLVSEAPNSYAGVDTVKDWFESQLDTWMTVPAARQHKNSATSTACL